VALILGPRSGVFGIDVDGLDAHKALLDRLGDVPLAPKTLSGSGKPNRYHLLFRHPDIATQAKFTPWHPKLEFRGTNGILMLPPSTHPTGPGYRWAPGQGIADLALPEVPPAVLAALKSAPPTRCVNTTRRRKSVSSGAGGERDGRRRGGREGVSKPSTSALVLGLLPEDPYPDPILLDHISSVWDRNTAVQLSMWRRLGFDDAVRELQGRESSERFRVPYTWRPDKNPSGYLWCSSKGEAVLVDHGGDPHTTYPPT